MKRPATSGRWLCAALLATALAGQPAQTATSQPSFGVGLRVLKLIDTSRPIHLRKGKTRPRLLVTYVRYPAAASPSAGDLPSSPPARAAGPFPLVVFGHGFAVTPALYAPLLRAWTAAGYVVVAPVFPLENANAPGGPDENDLVNQPADVSFVISQLLAANEDPAGLLQGMIDSTRIAVAGHSDGGETALAVAYARSFRDLRVSAAVILSGAKLAGVDVSFPPGSPPLLATQGSRDRINPPKYTSEFFGAASRPKFLLTLLGAAHLPPYVSQHPQLDVVERVTTAFLDVYLKGASLQRLFAAGMAPGVARLTASP